MGDRGVVCGVCGAAAGPLGVGFFQAQFEAHHEVAPGFRLGAQAGDDGALVVSAAIEALSGLGDWTTEAIQDALRAALVDGLGIKPKFAFGPVRLAITGSKVSPPLFESMELLGRESSLARLELLRAVL